MSGSKPAACLIRPSWLSKMTTLERDEALALLNDLYGVQELDFTINRILPTKMLWVDPRKILKAPDVVGTVLSIDRLEHAVRVRTGDREVLLRARHIVVAAGVWANKLFDAEVHGGLVGQVGCAHIFSGQTKKQIVDQWAPYKQIVRFNRTEDTVWVGDGAAIIEKNWGDDHRRLNATRCHAASEGLPVVEKIEGIRPYVKEAKGIADFREVWFRVWSINGGAKNGTMGAAWCALRLIREAI